MGVPISGENLCYCWCWKDSILLLSRVPKFNLKNIKKYQLIAVTQKQKENGHRLGKTYGCGVLPALDILHLIANWTYTVFLFLQCELFLVNVLTPQPKLVVIRKKIQKHYYTGARISSICNLGRQDHWIKALGSFVLRSHFVRCRSRI